VRGHLLNKKIAGGQRVRMLDGKVVKPVLFCGQHAGLGKYFAASIDGVMLLDSAGKPLLFRSTGELQDV